MLFLFLVFAVVVLLFSRVVDKNIQDIGNVERTETRASRFSLYKSYFVVLLVV